MSFLFGSTKYPEIQSVANPAVSESVPASEDEISGVTDTEKAALRKKKRSTILTGPRGILTDTPVALKTLLGQ